MFTKFIKGSQQRKSRFHDEKGNFAGVAAIITHGIPAFFTGVLRKTVNYRPEVPWISYSAIAVLNKKLNSNSQILEFGSGMSTIWLSKRAIKVYSIDNYLPWFTKVQKNLEKEGISNVHYHFAEEKKEYVSFMSNSNQLFDLILIDGSFRSDCLYNSLLLVKPGGFIYLDNSDRDNDNPSGDMRLCEKILRNFADLKNGKITEFTDFAPTQFFVQQGMLLELPK